MLLGALGAILLGNLWTSKDKIRAGQEKLEQTKIFNASPSFE